MVKTEITLVAWLLKPFAIMRVKYLQRKYKRLSIKHYNFNQSNRVLAELKLIQHQLYYYKTQFRPWGYFHPSCTSTHIHQEAFDKLFPVKDFDEINIVIHHNPEAVTFYKNEIYSKQSIISEQLTDKIIKQLKAWDDWN